jgi:integrase
MPKQKRHKTKYPGVFYILGSSPVTKKPEKIYYIIYRIQRKLIEEKAGRQYQDNMSPARASMIRAEKLKGITASNKAARDKQKWTLNNIWKEYQTYKSDLKCITGDKYRYNKYIKDKFGDKTPDQIMPLDIDKIKTKLQKTLKPQTVKHILVQIRRIINFGVSRQLCNGLSFSIEMPKFDNKVTEDLSKEQLNRLLSVLEKEENRDVADIMKLALFTGLRKSEILNLQWEDIDFNHGFIFIRDPKGKVKQNIPINKSTKEILHNRHQNKTAAYVFPSKTGLKRYRTSFDKPLRRICKEAELPKEFRPLHGLRHVYASMLASSGQVDMYTLQKLLTHKSPEMTQRYAHLRDETLKRASNLMEDLIRNTLNDKIESK